MNFYETLGVEPSADEAQIKKAFRKKASAAHPDKNGGSTEEMQQVNRAYEVLSDPERRAAYDETGDDKEPDSLEAQAMTILVQAFELALKKNGNVVIETTKLIKKAQAVGTEELAETKANVDRLKRRRDKITVESGENIVHALIDRQVDKSTRRIAAIEAALEVGAHALAMLEQYASTEETEQFDPNQQMYDLMNEVLKGRTGNLGRPFSFDFGR